MTIEERFKRHDVEDQIYIGDLVARSLSGEFGLLVKAVVNGMQASCLAASENDSRIPADRYLGRLEGVNKLLDQLEFCIMERDRLMQEQQDSRRVEDPADPATASGPTP